MGLDHVELIMRAEEEFGITIEDSEAEQLTTPGKMCALVELKLGILEANNRSLCPTSRAFYRVRRELMASGVERARIKPQAQLADVLPLPGRTQLWRDLQSGLAMQLPPILSPTPPFWNGALHFYLRLLGVPSPALTEYKVPAYGVRSIADLARAIASQRTDVPASQREIWSQVQLLVAEELSAPIEQVTHEADFFRDLGMG